MTRTPQPQVSSQNVRMLVQDLTPPTPSPRRHPQRTMQALTRTTGHQLRTTQTTKTSFLRQYDQT